MHANAAGATEYGNDSCRNGRNQAVACFEAGHFTNIGLARGPDENGVAVFQEFFGGFHQIDVVLRRFSESDARVNANFFAFNAEVQKLFHLRQEFFADFLHHVRVRFEVLLHGAEVSADVVEDYGGLGVCDRLIPTVTAGIVAVLGGASCIRVHDVKEAKESLLYLEALRNDSV